MRIECRSPTTRSGPKAWRRVCPVRSTGRERGPVDHQGRSGGGGRPYSSNQRQRSLHVSWTESRLKRRCPRPGGLAAARVGARCRLRRFAEGVCRSGEQQARVVPRSLSPRASGPMLPRRPFDVGDASGRGDGCCSTRTARGRVRRDGYKASAGGRLGVVGASLTGSRRWKKEAKMRFA